jgi:hypothetical protein
MQGQGNPKFYKGNCYHGVIPIETVYEIKIPTWKRLYQIYIYMNHRYKTITVFNVTVLIVLYR